MLNRVTAAVIAVELVAFLVWFVRRPRPPLETAGGVIVAGSLLLLIVARRHLGASFAVRARATRLVTTGVYARVRNPIYLAGWLLVAGVAMLLRSPWPLVLLAVLVPLQRRRARREAEVLRARFGAEYEAYRRRTWF